MPCDKMEKDIIRVLQGDLPLKPRPYEDLARRYSISEEEIVDFIKKLCEQKIIRRFGAVLRHRKVGYTLNAMVAWQVPEHDADRVGSLLASFQEVSHCYLRDTPEDFSFNLFTMIHSKSQEQLDEVLQEMAKSIGIHTYLVLKSIKELKKVSMKYV